MLCDCCNVVMYWSVEPFPIVSHPHKKLHLLCCLIALSSSLYCKYEYILLLGLLRRTKFIRSSEAFFASWQKWLAETEKYSMPELGSAKEFMRRWVAKLL